jgi:2-dehydro-3-deoxyglucarate aldolase
MAISQSILRARSLKDKLAEGATTVGSWITSGSCVVAEVMANAGFDWLVVDLEHSVIGVSVAGELIRIIDLCGVSPLVRLTDNNPSQIKRVMDAGAHGIIVPCVNTAIAASSAVAATRYAPQGFRGVGLARAQGYGNDFEEYFKWQLTAGAVVIVMIEHKDALSNLEEILTVPGVDGFLIGPYDLSCSLGVPGEFNNPLFIDTMNFIRETGERVGCPTGLHIVEPDLDLLNKTIQQGYNFIAYSVDIRVLDIGMRLGASMKRGAK